MREDEFARYLREVRGQAETTVRSRLSDCARVEKYEGDLDAHFDYDRMDDLIDRLTYSTEEERRNRPPRHKVPIRGNLRNGSATLKHAARLYRDFRAEAGDAEAGDSDRPPQLPAGSANGKRKPAASGWPDWSSPSETDMLPLARTLARYVRFLRPEIVEAVTKDNARHADEWRALLGERSVDPDIYLWDGSPCAFPGVRRYAGSDEIARFRKRATASAPPPHCLALDDNDYPKHVWAFVFTGKYFRKRGPTGYQLAHLADHKEHNNRRLEEFAAEGSESPPLPFGLFASPANAAFVPAAFLRPTDFAPRVRALLLRRAYRLYGGVCRIAPPPLVEKPLAEGVWDPDDFEWAPPVGTMEHMPAFLEFRRGRMAGIAER